MRLLIRLWPAVSPRVWFLLVLSSLFLGTFPILHAAEERSTTDLGAKLWQYIAAKDGEQADTELAAILRREDATLHTVQELSAKGPPLYCSAVGRIAG